MKGWQHGAIWRQGSTAPPSGTLHFELLPVDALQILEDPAAAAATVMNDRYFFGLLKRMVEDVQRQTPNDQRTQLLQRLERIQQAATVAAAGRQAEA